MQDNETEFPGGNGTFSEQYDDELATLDDDRFQIHQRRGRSTVQKRLGPHSTGSTSPSARRSTLKDDEIAPEGLDRFSRLYDDQFGIRPWGFIDKAVESKFVEYHWLTFMSNYKGIMTKLWGTVCIVHSLFAISSWYGEEVLPVAMSLLRCTVGGVMAVIFSSHNMVLIKRAQQFIILVYFQAIVPIFLTVEFINPATSQTKVTLTLLAASCIGYLVNPCSWLSVCWVYAFVFGIPTVIIFSTTWEEADHGRMVERAAMLLLAGVAGPLLAALFAVEYRRRWALSQRDSEKKKDASGEPRVC